MTASVDRETVPAASPGHKGPKVLKGLKVSKAAKKRWKSPRDKELLKKKARLDVWRMLCAIRHSKSLFFLLI